MTRPASHDHGGEDVVVPPPLVDSGEVDDWVRRSLAYAGQLPAKEGKQKG